MIFKAYEAFDAKGRRKYLTQAEGMSFLRSSEKFERDHRLFCEAVYYLGCRISEAVNLTKADLDEAESVVSIRSLKKRGKIVYRRIPVPKKLLRSLAMMDDEKLWSFSRTTAWRIVKAALADAGISGIHATAKGLRHGFGVRCAMAGIPISIIQRWMGHASPLTTAIYLGVTGFEERKLMEKTWVQT